MGLLTVHLMVKLVFRSVNPFSVLLSSRTSSEVQSNIGSGHFLFLENSYSLEMGLF